MNNCHDTVKNEEVDQIGKECGCWKAVKKNEDPIMATSSALSFLLNWLLYHYNSQLRDVCIYLKSNWLFTLS